MRAHGENMGKQAAFERATHQVPTTGVEPHLQVHRLRMFAVIKRLEIELAYPFKYNALAHITAPQLPDKMSLSLSLGGTS